MKPIRIAIKGSEMKKEIPILFSTPMVQAILDGRKTQTRRTNGLTEINKNPGDWIFVECFSMAGKYPIIPVFRFENQKTGDLIDVRCPYGKPGDILWVRETWQHDLKIDLAKDKAEFVPNGKFVFAADGTQIVAYETGKYGRWKPSIHMPKVACRIWLEVVGSRVERLQEITEEDAAKEGLVAHDEYSYIPGEAVQQIEKHNSAYGQFRDLWASINGEESWNVNPWVWVVEFKVLSTTGKPEAL